MKWTLSKQTLRACAFLSLCAISSLAQAVSINIPDVTIGPSAATVPVMVTITGGQENIQGVEFAFEVLDPSGRITITGFDLSPPNGLFTGLNTSTFDPDGMPVRPGEFSELYQQLVINQTNPRVFAHADGTKLLAVANLKLTNPAPGTYALRSIQTTTGFSTKVADDSTDDAIINDVQFIGGSITIVPEPSTVLMAGFAGFGLVVYGFRRRRAA